MDYTQIQSLGGLPHRGSGMEPHSLEECIGEGEMALSRGRYSEAEEHFKKAVLLNPFHPGPHSRLGSLYWRQGKTEDALNSLTRALELDADHREAVLNCAEVLASFNRVEDARQVLDAFVARHPDDQEAFGMLKALQTNQATFAPASQKYADFFNDQGEEQFQKGSLDHARACFEMALEHDPRHAGALSNRGIVAWREGNVEEALDFLYRALDVNEEDPDILFNCSALLREVGEWEMAASLLQMFLQKGHGTQEDWDAYARIVRQEGASSWSPAGLSEEVATIYVSMGRALCEAGDSVGGVEACEKAMKIAPDDAGICRQANDVLKALGMTESSEDPVLAGVCPGTLRAGSSLILGDPLDLTAQ